MANFIFDLADTSQTNLSSGTFYVHLVTTIPATNVTTVAQLVLSTANNYSPAILTGLSYTTVRWTFNPVSFISNNYLTAPVGYVICKQLGVNPGINDPVISYADIRNSVGDIVNLGTGIYRVEIAFSASGVINFTEFYTYTSAAYSNTESIPKGIIYLLGSNNNTEGFTNPVPIKLATYRTAADGATLSSVLPLTDQSSATSTIGSVYLLFDFLTLKLRLGSMGFRTAANFGTGTIYGSNVIAGYNVATITDNVTNWTLLGSGVVHAPTSPFWGFINSTNTNYWRYIKVYFPSHGTNYSDVEFYNSTIASPTLNMV
jgi:hypothetical protein